MQLRDYQYLAVQWLRETPRGALWLDMGLGKTASVLSALTPHHLPALVVAPKLVATSVWPLEAAKWRPDLSVSLVTGPRAQRVEALRARADVTVIGRDVMIDAVGGPWRTVIFDEMTSWKNHRSKRWGYAKKLALAAPFVWGLTGTPAPNGAGDLWAQAYLLDAGARLGRYITHFRDAYIDPSDGRTPMPGALEAIQDRISDITLCMSAQGRSLLPDVVAQQVEVEMPPASWAHYRRLQRELVTTVEASPDGDEQTHTVVSAAALTVKLQQATAGFLYPNTGYACRRAPDLVCAHDSCRPPSSKLHGAKLDRLREIVNTAGSPVFVLYGFQEEATELSKLSGARHVKDPGALAAWDRGEVPVLYAHPASAGHGLNLQYGGHTCVWTTPTWNLEFLDQANARLARPGQAHPVSISYLTVDGTVDGAVLSRADGKRSIQSALTEAMEV